MPKEVLAIIPARGGSKGLADKNILPLANHPLIAYSIKAALYSKHITRTIVSTDADEIAKIAKHYGAEVPFIRPSELAQDFSTDFEVFFHAINWLRNNEIYVPEFIVQLRPTTPVRTVVMINECIEKLINSDADSLRIVTVAPYTPYKMWTIDEQTSELHPLLTLKNIKEPYNQPRQILPKVYWHTGTLDVIRSSCIINKKSMSGDKILSYIMAEELAVDIDNIEDFKKAEAIISSVAGLININ